MEKSARLPYELSRLIDSELPSDEQVLWTAQPLPGRYAWHSLALVIFGIPWTAFSVFWVVMASGMLAHMTSGTSLPFAGFSLLFPLFGLPFVLIGLGLLSSPYWMRRSALRTAYALTNKRALIVSIGWRGKAIIQSIPPQTLADRQRTQNRNGSGSLSLPA